MHKQLVVVILVLAATFAVSATASEKFNDGAKVLIEGMPGGGAPIYYLEKTGEDKTGAGIYRLRTSYDNYLNVPDANAGTMVGWTEKGDPKGSEWILFKNSTGWSIIAKANGANAVSRSDKAKSGIELQRNQGAKHQVWKITQQDSKER